MRMPFTSLQLELLQEVAEAYVGAFVKCGCPRARYAVRGMPCDSIDQAVELAMDRCFRPAVARELNSARDGLLREQLANAIRRLSCRQ